MKAGEHVEVSIRAAQISSTLLGLLECSGIQGARLRFVMAVKQFKELDDLLTKIEEEANTHITEPTFRNTKEPQ